jgi:cell division protein FtsB
LIGKTRKEFKEEIEQNLKKGREYILDRARSSPLKSSLKEAS